jgi:pyrroline-5-carboxylate reductase
MKMAVIGCGNLATAVVSKIEGVELHTYTPSFKRADELAKLKSGQAYRELKDLPIVDYLVLGMKPQQFESFAKDFKKLLGPETVIISLLAGTSVQTIEEHLGCSKVVRVMSNTPALVGEGLHALYFKSVEKKDEVEAFFKASGKTLVLDSEDQIDAITCFSGSGPAYVFELARVLTSELVKRGFSEVDAAMVIKQTFLGSSILMSESDKTPIELRVQVTSKAGVTERVLNTIENEGLENIWKKALVAGEQRIKELKG